MCDPVTAVVTLVGGYFVTKEIQKMQEGSKQSMPMPAAPPPPRAIAAAEPLKDVQAQAQLARDTAKRRAAASLGMSGTAKTGALGVPGPAMGMAKSLLGQ